MSLGHIREASSEEQTAQRIVLEEIMEQNENVTQPRRQTGFYDVTWQGGDQGGKCIYAITVFHDRISERT